jgi:repressor LexA
MTYAELLKQYIKESRYTLEEISKILLNKGLSASREHLSRLQNGKVPPATDDINIALAEITGGDPDKLILYSYIEKAPEGLKDLLSFLKDEEIKDYLILTKKFSGASLSEEQKQDPDYIKLFNLSLSLFERGVEKGIVKRGKAGETIEENNLKNLHKVNYTLNVPVLGYIAAGAPILAEEHIIDYMEIPNPDKYSPDELFSLVVKGDSMTGSRIYEGDRVVVRIQSEVENGEIAVVNVDGESATLKKVKKYDDGSVWLISTNEKYAPIPLTSERARIIGKVIQVIFEP